MKTGNNVQIMRAHWKCSRISSQSLWWLYSFQVWTTEDYYDNLLRGTSGIMAGRFLLPFTGMTIIHFRTAFHWRHFPLKFISVLHELNSKCTGVEMILIFIKSNPTFIIQDEVAKIWSILHHHRTRPKHSAIVHKDFFWY